MSASLIESKWQILGFLLFCLVLTVGCTTNVTSETVSTAVQTEPTLTATIAATPTQLLAEPATFTPAPTPTQAATPTSAPSPTPAPIETPTTEAALEPEIEATTEPDSAESACRSLDQLTDIGRNRNIVSGPWPRPPAWNGELHSGTGAGLSLIHLGFDVEGPTTQLTTLLDILDKYNIKTTMFILGSWAEASPEWVTEFVARGHEVANHSYTHSNLGEMSAEAVIGELERTEQIVQQIVGQSTKPWLRPPFGSRSPESIQAAFDAGYTTVIWTSSTDDWRPEYTADDMCNALMEGAYPGAILYTHSYRPEIPEVTERFIAEMIDRGYTFVPLSVMMAGDPAQFIE